MDSTQVLDTLLHGNQLKRTARTGWVQRGVPDAESVAAHSFGVVFVALILAHVADEPLDLGLLLAMAALHDLPESLTSDIPTPAWRRMPAGAKAKVESSVMTEITDGLDFAPELLAMWQALQQAETAEARLVHDADKIDLYLQALVYEEQTGNRYLEEFWESPAEFNFPQAKALYSEIRRRREDLSRR